MNIIIFISSIFLLVIFILVIQKKSMYIWLPRYIVHSFFCSTRHIVQYPRHIMFCFVDHFEPGTGRVDSSRERRRVDVWTKNYPRLADRHCDADGRHPQHTWFYPPHYHSQDYLERIVKLCTKCYGEVEMHLHHSYDTSDSLREKIKKCIEDYSKLGIFGVQKGRKKYAFIHGDWSLDNSRGIRFCGVDNELSILEETGCYADFTFPCGNSAQPKKVNSIYYALDNPHKPKSYNTGRDVRVGGDGSRGLMIIQGPTGFRWKSRSHKFYPSIEMSNICCTDPPTRGRIDFWINTGIYIKGKPNWIFVKIHCHGALEEDMDVLLGRVADKMYSYLESKYNDGKEYVLHYVTAREMFNIVKAAEMGKNGNPNDYRDLLVKKN